jgi:hypothetical protein
MSRWGDNLFGNKTFGGGSQTLGVTASTHPLFEPSIGPSFALPVQYLRRVERFQSIKGYESLRALGLRTIRQVSLGWNAVTTLQRDEILSFFDQFEGLGGPFLWQLPWKGISPLGLSPALSYGGGGSLASRTYYVAFSWFSTSGSTETLVSKVVSLSIPASNLVTVSVPNFPIGADRARIYAGTSAGALTLQVTSSSPEWTEPTTGLVAGASPPAANTLSPYLKWVVSGDFEEALIRPNRHRLQFQIVEQII